MTPKLARLEELARAATPGPWSYDTDEDEIHADTMVEYGGDPYHIVRDDGSIARKNSEYIAAASPDAVLELIERLKRYEEALRYYCCVYPEPSGEEVYTRRAREALEKK